MKISVVIFQPGPNSDVGGFEWRFDEQDARAYEAEHKEKHPEDDVHFEQFEIHDGASHKEIDTYIRENCDY